VVIPTVGRPLLEGCLRSIAASTTWPAELIVIDQGASRAAAGWVEQLRARGINARHVPSAGTGIAAGTNQGLRLVRTRFVAVTHDDCRVRDDWLAIMAARLREAGEIVLTGRVQPDGDGEVPTTVTHPHRIAYTRPLLDRDVLFPANMGLPVSVLGRVGLLDEDPLLRWAAEDNDWAYRALRAGVPIVYEPDLVVGHLAWRDEAELAATYRRYARGQGCFYGKWLRRGDRFIALRAARDLLRGPWLLLRGLVTGNRALTKMGRAEVAGIGPGILAGLLHGQRPTYP
jgi:GT2 family glycosyltransferase